MRGIRAVVTYQCNFMCGNCKFKCAPYKKGFMGFDEFEELVLKSYNDGFSDYIILEGGEVFLDPSIVYKYLKRIRDINIKRYVVTNGFWGDLDIYYRILDDIKKLGVNGIIIEYDYFHSFFVSRQIISQAIEKVFKSHLELILKCILLTDDLSKVEDLKTLEEIKNIKSDFKGMKVIFETNLNSTLKNIVNKRWLGEEKLILYTK